ncbi:caspase family protein [Bacteroidota bacterium]
MKNLLLINLLLTASVLCYSQSNWQPESYSGIPENDKLSIFSDEFNDNNNLWDVGQEKDSWLEKIENGYLYFQSLDYLPNEDYLPMPFDESKDFEIELSIAFDSGDNIQAYGLQWGKTAEEHKQFDFFISGNGQYTIDKFTGEFTDYVPFTSSDLVKKDDYNKLTVRKIDDQYYFFLNESLIHKMPFEPFMGKNIGFQVGKKSAVRVDYIKVSELINSIEFNPSQLMIMDYKFASSTGEFKRGVPVTLELLLKNTGETTIENATAEFLLPTNTKYIGSKTVAIESLEPDKELKTEFQFFTEKEYPNNVVKPLVKIKNVDITNAEDLGLELTLKEPLPKADDKVLAENAVKYRGDPLKGIDMYSAQKEMEIGNYYAFIIGIDNYKGEWAPLDNAVNDAQSIEKVLKSKYSFDQIITLYNEQATRGNIIQEFEKLASIVKEKDNVLIYYSGHGDFKQDIGKGFWVPVNATTSSTSNYLSNADIQALLSGIKSKHTLLIADACFSGDIFRGKTLTIPFSAENKYYYKVQALNSRKAISSGGLEPVMDGGKDGHSVFAYYLLRALENNSGLYYDANQLFNEIKIPVVNNSEQTPGFAPIRNTGDEGGQFIFLNMSE